MPEGVSYTRTHSLRRGCKYRVGFGKWAGTVAVVSVNGKSAGVIGWPPYTAEFSELTANSEHRVQVVVSGSLKNLLGPGRNLSPSASPPVPTGS